jgi:hypothetical protein
VVDISAMTDRIRAVHHHDWGKGRNARWKMTSTTKDPFTADNDYSYLVVLDIKTDAEIFRRPVPALTSIWISPDSKYIVGVSNVKLWNPYQLVVFSRSGDRLFERDMTDVNWPGVRQSVSNWINWYKEPAPQMTIVEDGATATLSIEDSMGIFRQFQFPAVH